MVYASQVLAEICWGSEFHISIYPARLKFAQRLLGKKTISDPVPEAAGRISDLLQL